MYIIRLIGLVSQRKSLISTLIILEGLTLSIFFIIIFHSITQIWILLIIIVVIASEGAIGLSLLICLSRKYGNDLLYAWNIN